ncbi:MAG: RluA family pseudouridine synthase [Clostridia bacterium]|nr:RluA family pseudouridine synthase [Clostridia bacterium]
MREFFINKNDAAQRCDKFLEKLGVPRALIYKAIRRKDIKINSARAEAARILEEGDIVRVYLPDDCFAEKGFTKAKRAIEIIYEDENIAVINKPCGVPCQSGGVKKNETLVDMFKTYLLNQGVYSPENEQSFSPALCNRLDVNTSGLVIGAKNAAALRAMNSYIRARRVRKFYICQTEGAPSKDFDTVEGYIEKDAFRNKSAVVKDGGKYTKTSYRVLSRGAVSVLEVELHTGRSHQIRALCSYLGCPIVGDTKYGAKSGGGQALTAYKIIFDFEDTGILANLSHREVHL